MTGDEIGLHFYIDGEQPTTERPSVFSAIDQDDMIARLEANEDDDLASDFFGDSIQDVEDAAVRMFDVGIRTITQDAPAVADGAGVGVDAPAAAVAGSSGGGPAGLGPVRPAVVTVVGDLAQDAAAQRAFVLGGPAAISGDPA